MTQPRAIPTTPLPLDAASLVKAVRTYWRGGVALLLLALAAGGLFLVRQPATYVSTASALVTTSQAAGNASEAAVADNLARSRTSSYADLSGSGVVAERVAARLGFDGDPRSLQARITTTTNEDSIRLSVSATGASPDDARGLADAWMSALVDQVAEFEGETARRPGFLSLLPTQSAGPAARTSYGPVEVLGAATALGLALALGYAIVRRQLDRRVRTAEQVRELFGLTVVGALPRDPGFARDRTLDAFDEEVAPVMEAVRKLRTNLLFMDVDHPPRVVVVTSAMPGEGKSTVASRLAQVIAAGGQDVVLIDADLRRPTQVTGFGLVAGAGLTDVLVGRAKFDEVAQRGNLKHLQVLGAGQTPPNPSELLGSQRMRTLLERLAKQHIVIVDAPPLLPVTDAAVLTAASDGCLLIATAGRTTISQVHDSLGNLSAVGGRVLGVVMNGVERRASAGYYGYGYSPRPETAAPAETRG